MNEERQQERRQTLLIILAALLVAIACWVPIGYRMFWESPPPAPTTPESSGMTPKD